jgi:hypothetical protein
VVKELTGRPDREHRGQLRLSQGGYMATNEPENYADLAKLVQDLIDGACTTNSKGEVTRNPDSKISFADLIRLMQLHRETAKEKHVDIVEMRWIDAPPKS